MALIRSISTSWSDAVILSTDEVWQARRGAVFLTTHPSPGTEDGILLAAGKALRFAAGTSLRYRKTSPTEAMISREAIGGSLTNTAAALTPALFLVAGQSNAIGRAPFDQGAVHAEYTLQWDSVTGERAATIPLQHPGAQAGTMGFDVSFANAYRAAHPSSKVIFLPVALDDSGFSDNRWNPGDDLFEAAVAEANAAIAQYGVSGLSGILWQQGARDATSPADANAYQARLEEMVLGLRAAITGSEHTPFVAGEIGAFLSTATYPERDTVIGALNAYAASVTRTATVETGDLTAFDGVHFDAASLRTLGTRFFSALSVAESNTPAPVITGVPAISGNLTVGNTVTAQAAEVSPKPTTTSWQWVLDGVPIHGAIGNTYTIQASDLNGALAVRQIETGIGGTQGVTSVAGGVGASGQTVPAQVGGLTVTPGDGQNSLVWSAPFDGGVPLTDYVIEVDSGAGFSPLADGTGTATSFVHTGLSNGTSYAYRVTAVNALGAGTASAPQSGTPTPPASAPVNTGLPAIGGVFETREVLSVTAGSWSGTPAPTLSYQWTRDGVAIAGATAATYTLRDADEGAVLGCDVTASNSEGTATVSATGEGTVAAPVPAAVFLIAGQSNAVGWVAHDGQGDYPAETFEWNQAGQLVSALTPLDHVNEPAGSMGWSITFAEAFRAAHPDRPIIFMPCAQGSTGFHDGNWRPGDPSYAAAVARTNAALAANPDAVFEGILWHQGERDSADAVPTAQYATYMRDMVAGMRSEITGATSSTPFICGEIYHADAADDAINAAIRAVASDIAYAGFVDADTLAVADGVHFNAASLRTMGTRYYDAWVAAQTLSAPVLSGVPVISGTEQEGETLTATAAGVSGSPSIATTWQWLRSGAAIAGATSDTYVLAAADVGATLTVRQTATNSVGTASAESAATGVISAPASLSVLFDTAPGAVQNNLNITVVNRLPAATINGASGLVIELHGECDSMWIGHQKGTSGDDRYNFAEAPVQVFFNGGAAGVSGGTPTTTTESDPVAGFTHDGVRTLLIALDGASISYERSGDGVAENAFFKVGTPDAADSMSRTGYTENAFGRTFAVLKVSGVV